MFIHTHSSAPTMFAKFGWQIERFVTKNGKGGCQTQVRQTLTLHELANQMYTTSTSVLTATLLSLGN